MIGTRKIKKIFGVDETLLKINGQQDYQYLLWLAYEPNLNVCLLLFHLSIKRKKLSIYLCMLSVFQRYEQNLEVNKSIYTDGAYWYNDEACK